MCDGRDLDPALRLPEDNKKREAAEKISTGVAEVRRPLARHLLDLLEGGIELRHERISGFSIPGLVPLPGGACFCDCLRVNPGAFAGHYRPRIMRRASGQGTGATVPESSSRARLAISVAHSASALSSMPSSRLSKREAASAARASGDNLSASSRSFAGSGVMYRILLHCLPRPMPRNGYSASPFPLPSGERVRVRGKRCRISARRRSACRWWPPLPVPTRLSS